MNNIEIVSENEERLAAAHRVVDLGWDAGIQAELRADKFREAVVAGDMPVSELRGGVVWANALDEEAVALFGSNLVELLTKEGEQWYPAKLEVAARRIEHHAGRIALNQVRSGWRRRLLWIRTQSRERMPGMGGLETHDYDDRRDNKYALPG